jgi:hypothetical protein
MSLMIVTSGPKSAEPQLRTALASRGFQVQPTVAAHGLPDHPQGKKAKQPVAFVTVLTEDDQLDKVEGCAETLGYVLRLHHETPGAPEPSAEMELASTLADMRREIDELKARAA